VRQIVAELRPEASNKQYVCYRFGVITTQKNIGFRNSCYVILYPQPRCAIDGYPSYTGSLF